MNRRKCFTLTAFTQCWGNEPLLGAGLQLHLFFETILVYDTLSRSIPESRIFFVTLFSSSTSNYSSVSHQPKIMHLTLLLHVLLKLVSCFWWRNISSMLFRLVWTAVFWDEVISSATRVKGLQDSQACRLVTPSVSSHDSSRELSWHLANTPHPSTQKLDARVWEGTNRAFIQQAKLTWCRRGRELDWALRLQAPSPVNLTWHWSQQPHGQNPTYTLKLFK